MLEKTLEKYESAEDDIDCEMQVGQHFFWVLSIHFLYFGFSRSVFSRSVPLLSSVSMHDYGTIVLGKEGCGGVSGLRISFGTKVYIFVVSDSRKARPSEHTLKFLDQYHSDHTRDGRGAFG
jgi:hypothetical protein